MRLGLGIIELDTIVDLVHQFSYLYNFGWRALYYVSLVRFPHAQMFLIGSNAMNSATRVLDLNAGKPKLYWLHSLLMVLLSGFGGGFVTPLLIGKPSTPVTNDLILPISFLVWYLIHIVELQKLFNWLPIKLIWSIGLALFRTNSCCGMVDQANEILSPGPYYPHPMVGPIFTGTAVGCVGQFFPLDKGLSPVEKGTPWAMQGAFLSAAIYHIMVYDKNGIIGQISRATFGTHSAADIRVFIASMHMITLVSQTIFSQDFNLFSPLHKVLYLLTQVNEPVAAAKKKTGTVGWDYKTRLVFEKWLNWLRLLVFVTVVTTHITISQPPSALHPGSKLLVGQPIGSCQMGGSVRGCSPYLLQLEAQRFIYPNSNGGGSTWLTAYRLAAYNGTVIPNSHTNRLHPGTTGNTTVETIIFSALDTRNVPIWTMNIDSNSRSFNLEASRSTVRSVKATTYVALVIGVEGSLRLVEFDDNDKEERQLWVSDPHCPLVVPDPEARLPGFREKARAAVLAGLALHRNSGKPYIKCTDGSIFDL